METGNWKKALPFSSFCFIGWDQEVEAGKAGCQFPVSSLQFLPSVTGCLTICRQNCYIGVRHL